jgi:ABC-type lipoprotein release transport system permease subunit
VIALTVIVSLIASLAAGAYPAWRVCRTPAALYLKAQ